jgi:hypothetical protein
LPTRAAIAGVAAAALAACVWGCGTARSVPQPDGPPPDAVAVADAQRARLSAIPTLAMRGTAELRWSDGAGAHVEDGDFELVLRAPLDTSLRVTKFGERVMWAGSGGGRWWLFEPRAQPTRVTVGDIDVPGDGSGLLGLMRPGHLLATLGLRPIEAAQVRSVEWDSSAGCWRAHVDGPGGPMAVELRHASLLPVAVEWLDADGKVRLRSDLSAFEWPGAEESVTRPGALVPTRVVVRMFEPASDADAVRGAHPPAARASIALASATPTDGRARIRDRIFDFDSLRSALKPDTVVDAGTGNTVSP